MNGNIVGEEFKEYVFGQIGLRQSIHGKQNRSPEDLQYLSNNNSWVKLASPVSIEGYGIERLRKIMNSATEAQKYQGIELAKNSILFNGLSSLNGKTYEQRAGVVKNNSKLWNNSAYGLGGSDFGLQPPPHVTGVEVRCLNRGSIRKATIELKAFNKFQFEIIELLYLRLGYTIMLEWGSHKYLNNKGKYESMGNTFIETNWFQSEGLTQLDVLHKIEEIREIYQGNYDGFFGKVSNFDWSFENDGSYSIRLNLITLGDVIESLQANVPVKLFFPDITFDSKNEKLNDKLKESPIVTSAGNNVISAWMYTLLGFENLWNEDEGVFSNYFNLARHVKESQENLSKKGDKVNPDKIPPQYSYYVTLGELLFKVKQYLIPNIESNGKISSQLELYNNINDNYINYFPNQISLDPRICLIKPALGKGKIGDMELPPYLEKLNDYVGVTNNAVVGQLMNIYLNFDFISNCITSSTFGDKITIFKFLDNICEGINRALGGVNKIEVIIDEDNTIKFIDQTPIPGLVESRPQPDIVDLEVYGYNNENQTSNFVKSISFNTSITPALATQVTIGATAGQSSVKNEDATAFSKWNVGLRDRFAEKYIEPSPQINPFNEEDDERRWEKEAKEIWESGNEIKNVVATGKYTYVPGPGASSLAPEYKSTSYTPIKRRIPDNDTTSPNKTLTLEEYTQKYKSKKLEDRKANKLEPHDYERLLTENYVFYLSECFGGDIKYKVALNTKEQVEVPPLPSPTSTPGTGTITSWFINKFFPIEYEEKTVGGNGYHRYVTFDISFINRASNIYTHYLNNLYYSIFKSKNPSESNPSPIIGFIPLTFDIILKGISGIKIYNKLNINQRFLPPQYPEALKFIVTKVDHSIVDNEWETKLSTLSIPNISPKDYKQIWNQISLSPGDYEILLPEEIRGPKPEGDKLIILDNRNSNSFTSTPPEISVDELLKDFHPQAKPSFTGFFKELESNYKGYKVLVNSLQRDSAESNLLKEQNPANAAGGTSRHNYNTAIDFNITTPQGQTLKKSTNKNGWINHGLAKLAKKHNIRWGGTFDNYKDYVHFAWEGYTIEKAFESLSNSKEKDPNKLKLEV